MKGPMKRLNACKTPCFKSIATKYTLSEPFVYWGTEKVVLVLEIPCKHVRVAERKPRPSSQSPKRPRPNVYLTPLKRVSVDDPDEEQNVRGNLLSSLVEKISNFIYLMLNTFQRFLSRLFFFLGIHSTQRTVKGKRYKRTKGNGDQNSHTNEECVYHRISLRNLFVLIVKQKEDGSVQCLSHHKYTKVGSFSFPPQSLRYLDSRLIIKWKLNRNNDVFCVRTPKDEGAWREQ